MTLFNVELVLFELKVFFILLLLDFRSCPSNHYLFPGNHGFAESIRWSESIRLPLKNMVDKVCPTRRSLKRKLKALDFQVIVFRHMWS
jgi:hypothetical protein